MILLIHNKPILLRNIVPFPSALDLISFASSPLTLILTRNLALRSPKKKKLVRAKALDTDDFILLILIQLKIFGVE